MVMFKHSLFIWIAFAESSTFYVRDLTNQYSQGQFFKISTGLCFLQLNNNFAVSCSSVKSKRLSHLDFIDLMKSDFDYGDENASEYQKMKKIMAEKTQKFYKMF